MAVCHIIDQCTKEFSVVETLMKYLLLNVEFFLLLTLKLNILAKIGYHENTEAVNLMCKTVRYLVRAASRNTKQVPGVITIDCTGTTIQERTNTDLCDLQELTPHILPHTDRT